MLNGPRHRGSLFKNMACTERDQLLGGDFYAIMDKIEADMLQMTKKWNWKWIAYFNRKNPATNASFAPTYVHLQGWSLKFKTCLGRI